MSYRQCCSDYWVKVWITRSNLNDVSQYYVAWRAPNPNPNPNPNFSLSSALFSPFLSTPNLRTTDVSPHSSPLKRSSAAMSEEKRLSFAGYPTPPPPPTQFTEETWPSLLRLVLWFGYPAVAPYCYHKKWPLIYVFKRYSSLFKFAKNEEWTS